MYPESSIRVHISHDALPNHGNMMWNRKKEQEEMLNQIRLINPKSKMSLSQQCLLIAKGDIDEAKKLRDYFADVMEDLPTVDLPDPTWVDSTKDALDGILSWGDEHRQGLLQVYEIVRGLTGNRLPPLPIAGMAAAASEASADALPPINEG